VTVTVDEDVHLGGVVSVRREDDFGDAYGVEVTVDDVH